MPPLSAACSFLFSTQPVASFPRLQLLSASCPVEVLTRLMLTTSPPAEKGPPSLFQKEMQRNKEKLSPPEPFTKRGSTVSLFLRSIQVIYSKIQDRIT